MVVTGKWKQSKYRIERALGEGANGKVYLAQSDKGWLALKVGSDAVDLQSEINALRMMGKQKGQAEEQFLFDVDDLRGPDGREYPFYTMKYVRGSTLAEYLRQYGMEWFPLVALNLLRKLAKLHTAGWAFGDLKVENVMVSDYGYVELVDYGGATAFGKSIRQFTEIYDRGYWNEGARSSDPGYDLFSFGVLCIQLHEPKKLQSLTKELLPQNRSAAELLAVAEGCPGLKPVTGWLRAAFSNEYRDAAEAAEAWRTLMHKRPGKRGSAVPGWLKGLAVTSGLLLAASIVWFLAADLM